MPDPVQAPYGPRFLVTRYDWHAGIDIPADVGTPIHAIQAGVVQWAGDGDLFGWPNGGMVLILRHADNRLHSVYLHLDSVAPWIAERTGPDGKAQDDLLVQEGEIIAYSGITDARTPHLHLELRRSPWPGYSPAQRWAVNPFTVLPYQDTPTRHRVEIVQMISGPDGVEEITAEVVIPRPPEKQPNPCNPGAI